MTSGPAVALLAESGRHGFDTSSLRICVSGGDSIPATVLQAFEARLGVPILEGYGMTETASTRRVPRPGGGIRRVQYSSGDSLDHWGPMALPARPGDSAGGPVLRSLL